MNNHILICLFSKLSGLLKARLSGGIILEYDDKKGRAFIQVRNYFEVNSVIEIMSPTKGTRLVKVEEMFNDLDESIEVARHPMQILSFNSDYIEPSSIVRIVEKPKKVEELV